ncbi:DUF565 domain-containing protein [Chamaesiphon minutus]|uniref:DUF565 domain-containing protein n=1 Tax=Chamaesiphon minutus (strain ATCC 27169 / PCC 6605) TaxID=1173020 RepID=K9ULZ6_CHAP6|nr:DUF565 domain-containing protein [Chamaesiphon minutus]AFY96137.1 Protein of unknown function (DUF565) [Chamaesiphon minutus PCC 6605]
MQKTRLSTLFDRLFQQFNQWGQNPWRRISLVIISLLSGNFLATTVSTTTGQKADLDITVALILVTIVETVSWIAYGSNLGPRRPDPEAILGQRPLWIAILNSLKLGLIYGLFVEAFKLGS